MRTATMLSRTVLAGCALWAGAAGVAQAAEQKTFSDVTEVTAVEIPVQVVQNGEPVRGLKAEDFEVFDGRKRQPVTGFEVLDLEIPAAGPRAQAVAATARRRFLLLFDLSFSRQEAVTRARGAARQVLGKLHASDLVGVATFSFAKGPQMVLGFTADRAQVEAALDRLDFVERRGDPLRLTFMSEGLTFGSDVMKPETSRGPAGRAADAIEAKEAAEGTPAAAPVITLPDMGTFSGNRKAARDAEKSDLVAFTQALGAFSKALGDVRGRKYVVFLSEGFKSNIILGTDNPDEVEAMNTSSMRGDVWNIDSDRRFGSTGATNALEGMLQEMRRADCIVQAVDIGGARIDDAMGQDGLFIMAQSTGGDLYRNFNDLSAAMGQMLRKTSVTYVLSFQPDGLKRDGSYHQVRVELKSGPKGARVVHRPGYYAPRPYAEQSGLEKMLDTASRVVSGQDGGPVGLSVLAAPFRMPEGKAYVPVILEVDGTSLLAGLDGALLPAEVYAYALDGNGVVQDYFAQNLGLDLAKAGPGLQNRGLKFFGHLDLVPGEYSLRVLVRNGKTGSFGMRVVSMQVPAFSAADPVLLPPLFPDTQQDRWLIVRETPRGEAREVAYPFMAGERPYVPASLPVLAAGTEVPLALVGYHLRPGQLAAETRILTADGREAGVGQIRVLSRHGGAAKPDQLVATFRPPPALAAGDYLLLITVTDTTGATQTSAGSFRIAQQGGPG